MQADAAVKDYMLLVDAKSILEKKKHLAMDLQS